MRRNRYMVERVVDVLAIAILSPLTSASAAVGANGAFDVYQFGQWRPNLMTTPVIAP